MFHYKVRFLTIGPKNNLRLTPISVYTSQNVQMKLNIRFSEIIVQQFTYIRIAVAIYSTNEYHLRKQFYRPGSDFIGNIRTAY
jgi:hypothetical protein